MNVTDSDKTGAVLAAEDFIKAVASMLADTEEEREAIIKRFPNPTRYLGTDGTCWSEQEHRENYAAIIATARSLIR